MIGSVTASSVEAAIRAHPGKEVKLYLYWAFSKGGFVDVEGAVDVDRD